MAQGVLPFHYEADRCGSGLTGFAGLAVYLDSCLSMKVIQR